jgi:monothiol glutaredoxin
MKPEKVRLFVKTSCGWCEEAQDWLDAKGVRYEVLNATLNRQARREMQELSGQTLAPVIDVDGKILADFGADQLAEFWKQFEEHEPG